MISNQTLQNTIDGLHQITKVDFAVVDSEGGVLASTLTIRASIANQQLHLQSLKQRVR